MKGGPEHASPLVANGVVYHIGCAYDAETGKLLWKSPFDLGKKNNGRYSSPLLWASGGKNYVITTDAANDSSYVCLDAETGKVNWKVKSCVLFNTIIHDDILVAPLGENTPLSHAYKITSAGAELLWKGRFNTFSWGGLVYQDHLYGGHGQLFCASMKSGEVNWKVGGQDSFSAQIVADGKMFGIHDRADVETVPFEMIKATPEKHTVLGRFEPQAIPMCQPALANGRLYIRIKDAIACYDVREHGVYLDGVTATKDALTFRFKQTGGGLAARADGGLKDIQIVDAAGGAKPAQARIDGNNVVVDVKDVSMPFRVSCAANTLAGRNGQPVPAFGWNEARVLKYRKAVDQIIVLKSDIPLQQVGPWDKAQTFAVAGAKVTKVELDPQGKGVSLTTDKTWKPGDAIVLTYPGFPADQGDARRETLKITVAEFQPPAARFVRSDTTTSGDWKGKYGSEGVMIAGDKGSTQAPKCATVAVRNHSDEVPWAASAKDPTKLQLTGDNPGRSVVCWSAGDQLFLDIEITDGKEHQVAAYLVFGNCPVSVEAQDADTKAVLDTQADKGDVANKYLIWNIKGSVTLCISSTAESAEARAARIGGVFFDPPAPATQPAK